MHIYFVTVSTGQTSRHGSPEPTAQSQRTQSVTRAVFSPEGATREGTTPSSSGGWQNSFPLSCRTEGPSSCWLSAAGCLLVMVAPRGPLPCGPLMDPVRVSLASSGQKETLTSEGAPVPFVGFSLD